MGPWTPVQKDDKLYGRGGADDGYATFAAVTAIRLLTEQQLPHGRLVILIEAAEESGSPDLETYLEEFAEKIGTPELVVCLDSGCGNYDQLWMTTSLRGLVSGDLTIKIMTEGVHSGSASGIVPDTFRIARELLSRLEDSAGVITIPELVASIPADREVQTQQAAETLGEKVSGEFPWVAGGHPDSEADNKELLLRRTWRPALTVIGVDGFPKSLAESGNVLRPSTTLRLSLRIPPTVDSAIATQTVKRLLEANPPYGAEVSFEEGHGAGGWNAPSLAPWLEKSVNDASLAYFGKPAIAWSEGGGIPFMGLLGKKFPQAQFLITGLLGPQSNAHGPNESLDIPGGIRLTASVAHVIADHANS